MINAIIQMMEYGFIVRAMIVGILVSMCAAILGVSLILKRYSMIGDGLSHVGFGILTISVVMGWAPMVVSIPVTILTAIILLRIGNNKKINTDSAIAMIASASLATGVAVTSASTGMNTDVYNYMFGSILAMTESDVILSIIVSIIVIFLYIIFYRKIFSITFDESFAKANGLNVSIYTNLIAILTAVLIVVGMRLMGTMLISSIIIFPGLTSMRIFKSFKKVVISSVVVSIISFIFGIYFSYIYNISAGAMIVIVNVILFIIFTLISNIFCEEK